jgi:NAD+ kinase
VSKKKTVLLFCKRHSKAKEAGKRLSVWLKKQGYTTLDVTDSEGRLAEAELRGVGLGVIIGGDGTFLTLVRRLDNKAQFPLLGINLGSLGFITETSPDEMIPAVEEALKGKCIEEPRRLLQVEICRKDLCRISGLVFNDVVVTKDARSPMLKFDVHIGDQLLSYVRADGYIIATPTGSTAYALSCGGPLLHPAVNGLVLVPICSHSLSARPVVVPEAIPIRITPKEFRGTVYLVLDGQINHEIDEKDYVRIRTSDSFLKLVRSPARQWTQTIRSKLDMA